MQFHIATDAFAPFLYLTRGKSLNYAGHSLDLNTQVRKGLYRKSRVCYLLHTPMHHVQTSLIINFYLNMCTNILCR